MLWPVGSCGSARPQSASWQSSGCGAADEIVSVISARSAAPAIDRDHSRNHESIPSSLATVHFAVKKEGYTPLAMGLSRRAFLHTTAAAAAAWPLTVRGWQTPSGTQTGLFRHGVASGDPLTDRVILWTRVTPPAGHSDSRPLDVRWRVASDERCRASSRAARRRRQPNATSPSRWMPEASRLERPTTTHLTAPASSRPSVEPRHFLTAVRSAFASGR